MKALGCVRHPSLASFASEDSMKAIKLLAILMLALLLLAGTLPPLNEHAAAAAPAYDLIIRNGLVVDGTGAPGVRADVAVKGERIVAVGRVPRGAKAAREIDARRLVVAPGFIDMLGQSEQYVLIDRRAMSKVMMGVTTEI